MKPYRVLKQKWKGLGRERKEERADWEWCKSMMTFTPTWNLFKVALRIPVRGKLNIRRRKWKESLKTFCWKGRKRRELLETREISTSEVPVTNALRAEGNPSVLYNYVIIIMSSKFHAVKQKLLAFVSWPRKLLTHRWDFIDRLADSIVSSCFTSY